jgi:hypothetical protein
VKFSLLFLLLAAGYQLLPGSRLSPDAQFLVAPTKSVEINAAGLSAARNNLLLRAEALPARSQSGDRASIASKTVVFTRGKKGQDYPDYKEAIIHYPQITGLKNPAVLRRVQTAFSLKSMVGKSLEELRTEFRESWWLSEVDYAVNYNQNFILEMTFTISGVGAYPSSSDKHRIVELKTGKVLKVLDVFKQESLGTIAATVDRAMQTEIRQTIAKADPEGKSLLTELTDQRFQIQNLNDFSISDQGVTFLYNFDFPHVAKALEPPGRYFLSYKQLKPYIKQDGALGLFLKNQT